MTQSRLLADSHDESLLPTHSFDFPVVARTTKIAHALCSPLSEFQALPPQTRPTGDTTSSQFIIILLFPLIVTHASTALIRTLLPGVPGLTTSPLLPGLLTFLRETGKLPIAIRSFSHPLM